VGQPKEIRAGPAQNPGASPNTIKLIKMKFIYSLPPTSGMILGEFEGKLSLGWASPKFLSQPNFLGSGDLVGLG